jgi:hypothetical protein
VFGTWMDDRLMVVDLIVNANIVRCLSRLDGRAVPGFDAARAMLASRPWSAGRTPYYAFEELRAAARRSEQEHLDGQQADGGWPEITTCQDRGGKPFWRSRDVATALALAALHTGRPAPLVAWEHASC